MLLKVAMSNVWMAVMKSHNDMIKVICVKRKSLRTSEVQYIFEWVKLNDTKVEPRLSGLMTDTRRPNVKKKSQIIKNIFLKFDICCCRH